MFITGNHGLRVNSIADQGIDDVLRTGDYGIEDMHRIDDVIEIEHRIGDFGIEDMHTIEDQGIEYVHIIGG